MKITITAASWKKLAQSAGGAGLDAVCVLREGASGLRSRVEEMVSRVRLDREIRDLREEVNLQMRAVGEMIYASHRGNPSDSGQVQSILEYVDGLYEELDAHRRERETLRGLLVCSACGEANRFDSLYCRNCGTPLSRGS